MKYLDIILFLLYFVVGYILHIRAISYLKKPRVIDTYTTAYEPEKYRPEGERLRRAANRYWLLGGLAVLVAWWLT
jgi:hypothetical protein